MIHAFKDALRTGVSSTCIPAVGKAISLDGYPGIESIEKNTNGRQYREHIYMRWR
jgi:hypothetical protein